MPTPEQLDEVAIRVREATGVEIWFEGETRYGEYVYDIMLMNVGLSGELARFNLGWTTRRTENAVSSGNLDAMCDTIIGRMSNLKGAATRGYLLRERNRVMFHLYDILCDRAV